MTNYLLARPDVAAAYLYGSYGTIFQTPLSDVDLAILFKPGKTPDLDTLLELEAELSTIAQEDDLNVVVLNRAPLTLQFEILSTGRLLCKKNDYLEDFLEKVIKLYGDFRIDLDLFNREYDSALREVYQDGSYRKNPG